MDSLLAESSDSFETGSKKLKQRPKLSCLNCRDRKVKCDRILPCQACSLGGISSSCRYDAADEDRDSLRQAQIIKDLRVELEQLRKRQAAAEITLRRIDRYQRSGESMLDPHKQPASGRRFRDSTTSGTHNDLRAIVNAIALGKAEDAVQVVSLLRSGSSLESVAARVKDPRLQGHYMPLPRALSTQEILYDAFIGKFLSAFVAEIPQQLQLDTQWIRTLADQPFLSSQSRSALVSVATSFFGNSVNDPRIRVKGERLYGQTIWLLQKALGSETIPSTGTLCTVVLLIFFEFISDHTQDGWLRHIHGAERILELRGPHRCMSGIDHEVFLYFRFYGLLASLFRNKPNFLASEEWKTVPWSKNPSSKDLKHRLFDHILEIPEISCMVHALEDGIYHGHISVEEAEDMCSRLVAPIRDVTNRLHAWKHNWADNYGGGRPYNVPPPLTASTTWETYGSSGYHFPPFVASHAGPQPNIYYPDIHLAQAMMFYYAGVLTISRQGLFGRRDLVQANEDLKFSLLICQSAEYFTLFGPGEFGALAALVPLRCAYAGFAVGSLERNWLEGLFAWMARKTSLGMSQHARPDLRAGISYGRNGRFTS